MRYVRRKVQRIVDGDTFTVRRNVRGSQYIRVANLNAPEKGEGGYYGAKRKLARILGEVVTIRPKARSYGRVVGEVIFKRRKIR